LQVLGEGPAQVSLLEGEEGVDGIVIQAGQITREVDIAVLACGPEMGGEAVYHDSELQGRAASVRARGEQPGGFRCELAHILILRSC
jgi:hypothetical protein